MFGHSFSIAGGLFRKSNGKICLWEVENPSYVLYSIFLPKGNIFQQLPCTMLNISVCIALRSLTVLLLGF